VFYLGVDREQLDEVANALNVLAKRGLLYGGFRRRQRRIVEVHATSKYILVRYEDGDWRPIDPQGRKTHNLYIRIPTKT
jgi:hypothetical protein